MRLVKFLPKPNKDITKWENDKSILVTKRNKEVLNEISAN